MATSIPALLGGILQNPLMGWAALGGFEAIVADIGGSYSTRVRAMGLLSIGGAFGLFVGTLAGGTPIMAVACTMLWGFLWSYLSVLGGTVRAFNVLIIVIYLCGLGNPTHSPREAGIRALYLLGGGAWAMVLSLFVWPLHPYRPARRAVAECYAGLASFAASIEKLIQRQDGRVSLWHRNARHHQYRMRNLLEHARVVVAETRRSHVGQSPRGEQLLVLLETADVMLGQVIAVSEHAEHMQVRRDDARIRQLLILLRPYRLAMTWVADVCSDRRGPSTSERDHHRTALRCMVESLRDPSPGRLPADAIVQHLAGLLTDSSDVALAAALSVRLGTDPVPSSAVPIGPDHRNIALPSRSMIRTLLEDLSWDSATLRYAMRISLVCGLDTWVTERFHIDHGYWITLTSVIVLQPTLSATWRRSLQRVLGTVTGGILAAVLAYEVRSPIAIGVLLFPLAFTTMATLPVSYAAFACFLTPTFVLANLPSPGHWQLAAVRTLNTIGGAVIATIGMYSLWPQWEHERFHSQLVETLAANVAYFRTLVASWQPNAAISPVVIARARRRTGLMNNAAEESLDHILHEPKVPAEATEPALAFLTYMRRFAQSITTLHAMPRSQAEQSPAVQLRLQRILSLLEGLQRCLSLAPANDECLSALLRNDESAPEVARADFGVTGDQLDVLERQARVMAQSFWRMSRAWPSAD